jgi:putative salt-induced outer membrane protein
MIRSFVALICLFAAAPAFAEDGLKSEAEAGVVLTSGNTETTTLNAKETTTYEFNRNVVRFTAGYLYQKTGAVVSAKAWNLGLRYERMITERFSIFLGQALRGDRFKGILQAHDSDLGAKYYFAKEDGFYWFGEGGYRLTRERALSRRETKHFARAYTEVEKRWNASVSTKYWLELLPNLKESTDWMANTELSLAAVLTSVFSVKTGYLIRIDHEPNEPGLKKTDRIFTTALVAKF